jgi:hypothetical protein
MDFRFRKRVKLIPGFWFNSHSVGCHSEPVDQAVGSDPPPTSFAFPAWVLLALFVVVLVLGYWH